MRFPTYEERPDQIRPFFVTHHRLLVPALCRVDLIFSISLRDLRLLLRQPQIAKCLTNTVALRESRENTRRRHIRETSAEIVRDDVRCNKVSISQVRIRNKRSL